jgi:hypothetical protein
MPTIQERIQSLWHSRRIQKPYEDGDQTYINVYSPVLERGLQNSEYLNQSVSENAANLILDYYGLAQNSQAVTENIGIADIYFPSRKMSNPILKMGVQKSLIETASDLVGDTQSYALLFTDKEINDFKQTINSLFPVYQQQLKFFNGSISPNINFLDLQDKIGLFFDNLAAFIEFNGYSTNNYNKVGIKFDAEYAVQSVIIQQKQTNNLINIPLVNGVRFYFQTKKEGSNKYVNEIVSNMRSVMLDTKMKINWTQFIYNYLSNAGVQINFYGKPRTETEASKASEIEKEGDFGPLAVTVQEGRQIQVSLTNRLSQEEGFKEAQKEIQKTNLTLQSRLQKIVADIENVNNEIDRVKAILNKYNITTLLEAALECLLFKGGFNGAIPDFLPGFNPFEPQFSRTNFTLPEIPLKLPIITINKELQVQVRENLKRAAISAAMSAIQTIALLIKEYCLRNDADTPSTPTQDLFPDPDDGLYDCYRDFGFIPDGTGPNPLGVLGLTDASVLEGYLTDLSPLITPRELCDLFNDTASGDVLQVANNLIDTSWPQVRINFPDSEAIQSFFSCIGNLLDPSYCEGVYNDLTQDLPEIDPCTIEDSQPYQDIVDLLENINDLYQDPDMACGAGIVPPLAEIGSYNDSVTRLIDSVVSTVQQVFVNDLGNFKESVVVPKPLDPADQKKLKELETLLQFLQPPPEPDVPDGAKQFFDNLIPDQLLDASSDFKNIHNALTAQARGETMNNIKELLANQEFIVAPETRATYEAIEDNFLNSVTALETVIDPFQDDPEKHYAFSTSLNYASSIYGRDILFSFGKGLQQQSELIDIFTTPLGTTARNLKSQLLENMESISYRTQQASSFTEKIFDYFLEKTNFSGPLAAIDGASRRKLYPYFYFGLANSLAYRISVSDLFDADTMSSLNLFPKLCQDGSISNSDLLDVNSIKQSALQEFADNSCIDREFELGPVRDAGVQAIVELYMQVMLVDLVLKNIFMTSKFGIDYLTNPSRVDLGTASSIINELLNQTMQDIRRVIPQGYNMLPKIVKQGASMIVKKVINRSLEPNAEPFRYPLTGDLPENQQQFISSNNFEPSGVSLDDPILQNIATQYFFEKRLRQTTAKINTFFNIPGGSGAYAYIQRYLHNGVQFVDMKQMDTFNAPLVAGNNIINYFTKYNYIDQGREVYDLYYSQPTDSDAWISFDGSVTQQRIEKEADAFLKYGTFVAEKYFEVEFSPAKLIDSEYPQPVKDFVLNFFDELQPTETTSDPTIIISEIGSTGGANSRYLLNFETFSELFNAVIALSALDYQLREGTLTAYLTGYNTRADNTPATLPTPRRVPFQIKLNKASWDDSAPRKLSDYTLIRSWWKTLGDGLNIYRNEDDNPQKFDMFSPLNADIPDFSKDERSSLEKYPFLPAREGLLGLSLPSVFLSKAEDPSEGLFFNAKLLEGKSIFGYDNFSTKLNELASLWKAEQVSQGVTYIVAESKSFAVIVIASRTQSPLTVTDGDDVFYVGFKKKSADGNIPQGNSSVYSSLDLWDGNEENVEFSTSFYAELENIFNDFENEEALLNSLGVTSPEPEPDISVVGINEFEDAEQELPFNLDQIREILPSIQMKTRMVYVTPEDTFLRNYFKDTVNISDDLIKSEKTFYPMTTGDSAGRHVATNYHASLNFYTLLGENQDEFGGARLDNFTGMLGTSNRLFEGNKDDLIQQLSTTNQLADLMGPYQPVNLQSTLQYLYITGEIKTYYDLFASQDIFTDTKALLVLALQAAFGSEDSACDVSSLQNALLSGANRSLAPIASMGQSFLNKMLKETPKYILKGVVELTEPHVIISKKVKEVSGGVFGQIKIAEDLAAAAAAAGSGLANLGADLDGQSSECGPDLPESSIDINAPDIDLSQIPNLQQIITLMQEEIDRAFPPGFPDALKPSITEKGLDLEGTVPYTFFVPPLTPFGIIYLLLRLSELGQQQLEVEEDCADQ